MISEQVGNGLAWAVGLSPDTGSGPLQYDQSFDEAKAVVLDALIHWYPLRATLELELSQVEACVHVKNQDLSIVADNPFFRQFFHSGLPATGRDADLFALKKTVALSKGTDQLLCDGASSVEFFHIGSDCVGGLYSIQTFKRRLEEFQDPNFHILEISRPIQLVDAACAEREKPLTDLLRLFRSLDDIDQTICRADAQGETTKEIAARVGLTPRSIEIRRKKMLDLFGIARPMELIRITIRLEEQGLLPD